MLEYLSMVTGYRALLIVVAALYALAFVSYRVLAGRGEAAAAAS
jgi:hypothetical protein